MHLLAMDLNLGKHTLEHVVSHSVAKRRAITIIQSEVVIKGLQKIREHEDTNYAKHSDPSPSPQAKGEKPKTNQAMTAASKRERF